MDIETCRCLLWILTLASCCVCESLGQIDNRMVDDDVISDFLPSKQGHYPESMLTSQTQDGPKVEHTSTMHSARERMKNRQTWMSLFENRQDNFGSRQNREIGHDEGEIPLSGQCEAIHVSMCKTMPWNMTKLPNLLHQSTQENAKLSIEQYQQLVETNCSESLLFFLCAMYTPICAPELPHQAAPPCRSVCLRARTGCEPIMNRYNVTWPANFNCKQFPRYHKGICLSPEAIVSSSRPPPDHESPPQSVSLVNRLPDCKCKKKKKKLRKSLYLSKRFDYVLRGQFVSAQGIIGGPLIVTVSIDEVLKSSNVVIPTNTELTLWAGGGCVCPKLVQNKSYLFLGFEDTKNNRLLFDESCMAVTWREVWYGRIKTWENRGRSRLRRGRGRRRRKKKKSREYRDRDDQDEPVSELSRSSVIRQDSKRPAHRQTTRRQTGKRNQGPKRRSLQMEYNPWYYWIKYSAH